VEPHPADTPPWHDWVLWGFAWGGMLYLMGFLNVAGAVVMEARDPRALLAFLWSVPLIAVVLFVLVVPTAALAMAVRAVWRQPVAWRGVLLGGIAAPLGASLILLPTGWSMTGTGGLIGMLPTMVINGGAAGWLADRRLSARTGRWWGTVLGAVALGLVLWTILDPGFPVAG
jgi:hypothetical protein